MSEDKQDLGREKYKKILLLENAVEAQFLETVLKERGIPYLIRSYSDLAYDGLFQFQKGWGHVEAPEQYKQEIEEIHKALPREE